MFKSRFRKNVHFPFSFNCFSALTNHLRKLRLLWHILLRHFLHGSQKLVPAQLTHLCKKNVIEQQLCFWLIFGDICIGIHPKDFWCRGQWQSLCVFDVAFVLQRWRVRSQEVRNQLYCRERGNFQYTSYWVEEPVRMDVECFHCLSAWAKFYKTMWTHFERKSKMCHSIEMSFKWRKGNSNFI